MATIVTRATGDPDRATVEVTVEHAAHDARTASEAVADRTAAVRRALADEGRPEDRLRSTQYDVREPRHPEHEAPDGRSQARHTIRVTLRDVDAAGAVVDVAVDAGATRVDGVEFGVTDDRRRTLRRRALEDAMTRAREQAPAMAEREDLAVEAVERAEAQGNRGPRPQVQTLAADSPGGGGGPPSSAVRPRCPPAWSHLRGRMTVAGDRPVATATRAGSRRC